MHAASQFASDGLHNNRPWCRSRRSWRNRKYLQTSENGSSVRNKKHTKKDRPSNARVTVENKVEHFHCSRHTFMFRSAFSQTPYMTGQCELHRSCYAENKSLGQATTQVNSALHLSAVSKSSTSFGWGKGGKVTVAGWQVTLCNAIWHVISSVRTKRRKLSPLETQNATCVASMCNTKKNRNCLTKTLNITANGNRLKMQSSIRPF